MLTAIVLPVLLGFVGVAIDMNRWHGQTTEISDVADSLAMRGAREFLLANATKSQVEAVVNAAVVAGTGEGIDLQSDQVTVVANVSDFSVTVTIRQPPMDAALLGRIYPYNTDFKETAVAVAQGGANVCVVALEESEKESFLGSHQAAVSAKDCAMYVNSSHRHAISLKNDARLDAIAICSGGGYKGASDNFTPVPTTDCPIYPDPLADRKPPAIGACDYTDYRVGNDFGDMIDGNKIKQDLKDLERTGIEFVDDLIAPTTTEILSPGVYCGGLVVGGDAEVTLSPGVYVIKDGPLALDLGARMRGNDVSFLLTGADASIYFGPASFVRLSARESGPLAGILFFGDRDAPADEPHRIMSDNARELIGTIYFPEGELRVASLTPIAGDSAYTAIVAKKLQLAGAPVLVLNTDYEGTPVPVPDGIGPVGGGVTLRE